MAVKKDVVVFLIPTFERGGAEVQLLSIVEKMAHEQDVIVIGQNKGALIEKYCQTGANIITIPAWNRMSILICLYKLLLITRKHRITLIEAFLPASIITGALVRILRRRNVILIGNRRSHVFYREGRAMLSYLDKWATAKCDALVCNSQSVADEVASTDSVNSSLVHVIPNGISPLELPSHVAINDNPKIFHVSNHHTYKRTITLLQAVVDSPVLLLTPVHLYGEGAETRNLQTFAEKQNLNNFIFHGQISNVWSEAEVGDLFVHTSETEGFSNAVLEAMNFGLVPVLTDIPSNQFVAKDCAFYFPVNDHEKLRDLLEIALSNKQLRQSLVRKSHQRVFDVFSIAEVVRQRNILHKNLLSQH